MNDSQPSAGSRRVYRMRTSQRFVWVVFLAFGVLIGVGEVYGVLSGVAQPTFLTTIFPPVFIALTAIGTLRAFSNWISLSDAEFEACTLRGKRVLPRDKVRGRRKYCDDSAEGPNVWHLVVETNDDRFPKIDIEELYQFDDYFYRWFNSLPDLDELDKYKLKTSNFGLV